MRVSDPEPTGTARQGGCVWLLWQLSSQNWLRICRGGRLEEKMVGLSLQKAPAFPPARPVLPGTLLTVGKPALDCVGRGLGQTLLLPSLSFLSD